MRPLRAGLALLAIGVIVPAAGQTIAATPPMDWNSWDAYGISVTEAEVKANADYIHLKTRGGSTLSWTFNGPSIRNRTRIAKTRISRWTNMDGLFPR
jgi:hypothetical protein